MNELGKFLAVNVMTLRDYFAAAALPLVGQVITSEGARSKTGGPINETNVVAQCYAIADAMLIERDK
jgi:hypothetical protein